MAGAIHGAVDCYLYENQASSLNEAQAIFTRLYKFFISLGNVTLVARNSGLGAASGDVNYWFEANPFLPNAWAVFKRASNVNRAFDYYVMIQFSSSSTSFGASPGNPGLCLATANSSCVGIAFCIGVGGDGNPWKGAGVLGANTKGATVWGTPTAGTTFLPWPRSNGTSGTHAANRENMLAIAATGGTTTNSGPFRLHCLSDDDAILIAWDPFDAFNHSFLYFGPYTPLPGLTVDYPFCLLLANNGPTLALADTFGDLAGSTAARQGGVVPQASDMVRNMKIDFLSELLAATQFEPNTADTDNASFTEYSIPVLCSEATFEQCLGNISAQTPGAMDGRLLRMMYNAPACRLNQSGTRMVLSATAMAGIKVSIPWPADTQPRGTRTRDGIVF